MTKGWAEDRSLERIRLLAGSDLDHKVLRGAVPAELGRMLAFDAFVWPLCDPRTAVGMAPRARIPCPQELPRLIRLKYLSGPGRRTSLMHASPPATTLVHAAQGDPSRSPVWNGLLERYGVRDVLSAVFADKYGCWAWLDLWRTGASGRVTGAFPTTRLPGRRGSNARAARRSCQGVPQFAGTRTEFGACSRAAGPSRAGRPDPGRRTGDSRPNRIRGRMAAVAAARTVPASARSC